MEVKLSIVERKVNKISLEYAFKWGNGMEDLTDSGVHTHLSEKFICGLTAFQVKIVSDLDCYEGQIIDAKLTVFIKLKKLYNDDPLKYNFTASSETLKATLSTNSDNEFKHFFHRETVKNERYLYLEFEFDLTVTVELASSVSPYSALYADEQLTDFELCASDGSVKVHKAVLASVSSVFYAMLNREWTETVESSIKLADTSIQDLRNLKEYIYLHKLPEEDDQLTRLVALGSMYEMTEMVKKCCVILLYKVSEENIMDVLEYAFKYKLSNLVHYIMKYVKTGVLDVDKIPMNQSNFVSTANV